MHVLHPTIRSEAAEEITAVDPLCSITLDIQPPELATEADRTLFMAWCRDAWQQPWDGATWVQRQAMVERWRKLLLISEDAEVAQHCRSEVMASVRRVEFRRLINRMDVGKRYTLRPSEAYCEVHFDPDGNGWIPPAVIDFVKTVETDGLAFTLTIQATVEGVNWVEGRVGYRLVDVGE